MSPDPYVDKLLNADMPCVEKNPVVGRLCCVLHAQAEQRGLQLAPFPSRVVQKHEIHELILTTEESAGPGQTVNQIAYVGFFEVLEGGVLWAGDQVEIGGRCMGALVGYDLTHFPNHFNIVIRSIEPISTGFEFRLSSGRCRPLHIFRKRIENRDWRAESSYPSLLSVLFGLSI